VEFRSADGGGRFVFGSDCGPSEELVEFARGADLLMAEATVAEPDEAPRGHLTAAEAGEHARAAGVQRLVITHFSDEMDQGLTRDQAANGFGGDTRLAAEGDVYTV
jgi:ribonuclease BN (tRNA processing enzyme)